MCRELGLAVSRGGEFSKVRQIRLPGRGPDVLPRYLRLLREKAGKWLDVRPDRVFFPESVPDDPFYGNQWAFPLAGAEAAWDYTTGSREIVVAIVDTGMMADHEDLSANLWHFDLETPDNGVDDDGNGCIDDTQGWDFYENDNLPQDTHGHGTHLAGTIGAAGNNGLGVCGANWRVKILPLRAGAYSFPESLLVLAIDYAVSLKKDYGVNVAAINNSYGGRLPDEEPDTRSPLYLALERAGQADILCPAAAGNDGTDNDSLDEEGQSQHVYPSDYDPGNILSVTATDSSDALFVKGNYGIISVDMAAPGVGIYSTRRDGTYENKTGTSMAAAMVSGAAGLTKALNPNLGATQIKHIMLGTAYPLDDLAGKTVSAGRLDLSACILEANTYCRISWTETPPDYLPLERPCEFTVEAWNEDGAVAAVNFYLDGGLVFRDEDGSDGWSHSWTPAAEGDFLWKVSAEDGFGREVFLPERKIKTLPPYAYWKTLHWGEAFASEPSADDLADPDSDRLENLLEFYFNTHPLAAYDKPSRLPVLSAEKSADGKRRLVLNYHQNSLARAGQETPQTSADLTAWADTVAESREILGQDPETGDFLIEMKIAFHESRRFIRLRITPP